MANEELTYNIIAQDAYEGASTHYRLEQKGLISGDQDTIASRQLENLWMRSHHAIRNNGWAAAAKLKYRTNLGALKVIWKNTKGKPHVQMQELWNEFIANPNLDGYGTLANTQDIWNSAMFESGEALTRMLIKVRKGHRVPLVLQTIESEFLDPKFTDGDPENTRNGITFKDSKPDIYHFFKKAKANAIFNFTESERVKVDADDILHMFIRERAGQWRGIPSLASVLLPLYELDELTDATVTKQKAAQAVAWIVENTNPAAAMAIGTVRETTDTNDVDEVGNKRKISQAAAGNTQYLNKGEKLILSQGTDIGSSFDILLKAELHKIFQAVGLNYETVTGDLTGISFSALKFVINEMRTRAEFIYNFYTINLSLQPLCDRFQELAALHSSKSVTAAVATYQFPRRYSIDDLKDIQADALEVASGLVTLESKWAERNVTFEEIVEDMKKYKEAGIEIQPSAQSTNTDANSNSSSV